MAQPVRPRPRPRLVSKEPANSSDAQPTTIVDEDDLFRKNKGRTAQHWKQLEQSAARAMPFTVSDDDWGIDESTVPSQPRKKKKPAKGTHPSRWDDTIRNVKNILPSDDEDDEVQIVEHTANNPTENTSPKKRKRDRSRSKSITPPPALPKDQREKAMYLVRQALAVQPRPPSPTFNMDDSTDMVLDPELAKIAEEVRQRVKGTHIDPERAGGPESVDIDVQWRPHPRNTSAQEQRWAFKIRRHDTFRELFDEVADLAGIMADQLVVNHNHRRVFASGTPHSLHMWAEGELEACDKHTAEYLRAQQKDRESSPYPDGATRSPSATPQSDVESDAESEIAGRDTIKLVFRSAATKDKTFPLTVRSTTTCGAIVEAFLKAAGLPNNYSRDGVASRDVPRLMVDGEKMDFEAAIGNADLEDGDLVEIVGV